MQDAPHVGEVASTEDPILVYGSNSAGRNGRGAAADAAAYFGARHGVGEGLNGHAYAIPTKDAKLRPHTIDDVRCAIERFKAFARTRPDLQFDVTRVGCGLAGFQDSEIAPAFADAPKNCTLPYRWQRLGKVLPPRIIVAGSTSTVDYYWVAAKLDHLFSGLAGRPVIVGASERGGDRLGERYARGRRWPVLAFAPNPQRFGSKASVMRDQRMSWASSHLVVFWDGRADDMRQLIDMARRDGVLVRVIDTNGAPAARPEKSDIARAAKAMRG